MAVVVRCPGCRGAARVGPEAIGLLVVCPRCSDPFLAVEEAIPVSPSPDRGPAPRPSPRPTAQDTAARPPRGRPVEPARPRRRRAEPASSFADADTPPARRPRPGSDAAHPDPHDHPVLHTGGVPVSVLIGLALLPFAIPLLWLIGPLVLDQQPALSLAAPASLALSASVLCLAVVYTVDWSAATRVKGVLMLVGLAYFAGLSLFFLKKEMVDRAKEVLGTGLNWRDFSPDKTYRVKMPGRPAPTPEQPLPGWTLACHRSSYKSLTGTVVFVVGTGLDKDVNPGDDARWLDEVKKALCDAAGGAGAEKPREVKHPYPGWEWEVHFPNGQTVRTVRVHRAAGKIYYLSAEGPDLNADDELPQQFFDSFLLTPGKP